MMTLLLPVVVLRVTRMTSPLRQAKTNVPRPVDGIAHAVTAVACAIALATARAMSLPLWAAEMLVAAQSVVDINTVSAGPSRRLLASEPQRTSEHPIHCQSDCHHQWQPIARVMHQAPNSIRNSTPCICTGHAFRMGRATGWEVVIGSAYFALNMQCRRRKCLKCTSASRLEH
jgi:hypothetical protein